MPKATSNRERLRRSPIIQPGYRSGVPPANKGRKLPAEALTPSEMRALMRSFGQSPTGLRNLAMALLMYRSGLRVGEVVALERRHYEIGSDSITRPATGRVSSERKLPIDPETRHALDTWMAARRRCQVPVSAPLFCTITKGMKGNRVQRPYIANALKAQAEKLGIDRRVTSEGLRLSGRAHRESARIRAAHLIEYIDQELLRIQYPDAFAQWESAVDLFTMNPERYASRIGHDCREAMLAFVDRALEQRSIRVPGGSGTVDKLRMLIRADQTSVAIGEHLNALVAFWGTTSDLANRQEHAAAREGEPLGADDAHRLVFHTILVMSEVDRAMRASSAIPLGKRTGSRLAA